MKRDDKNIIDYCVGGDINQTQNCNINVEQPNNNVIASSNIDSTQSNSDNKRTDNKQPYDRYNSSSEGQISQKSNCNQKTKQPESNVYSANDNTISQANNY
ncbi:hypothetical protein [Halanaerobaculum tunisiense]